MRDALAKTDMTSMTSYAHHAAHASTRKHLSDNQSSGSISLCTPGQIILLNRHVSPPLITLASGYLDSLWEPKSNTSRGT